MQPRLSALQPYPFERLRALVAGVIPRDVRQLRLSIGEPQHPTPAFIKDALIASLDGLASYPTTIGSEDLREAMARWFSRRFRLPPLNPATQVLPVNGSREALFAFAQTVIDPTRPRARVACPNPFYQIYEGAALLAGATPVFVNQTADAGFAFTLEQLPRDTWADVQLLFVCSPGNPTGHVLSLDDWQAIFDLSDEFGFVIASDECYSEIYFDENTPPLGGLEAAQRLGRTDYRRLVAFTSLSKRSNVPGLRSGGVAGDEALLREFLRYRTYHGCAMSPSVQAASAAAWRDEAHVRENRAAYRAKFERVVPMVASVLDVTWPAASFYLWAGTRGDDTIFTRELLREANVAVLPGRYLAREASGVNPGEDRVRIALVPSLDDCVEAAERIVEFCRGR